MFKLNKKYLTGVFPALAFALFSTTSLGLVGSHNEGIWPESWPKELEPYRKQAKTIELAAGNQENVYEIHFENREEFEKLWPTILKLKDKGAPIRFRSIEKPFKKGSLFNNEKPAVRIFSHVWPAYGTMQSGGKKLIPAPPWPYSIYSSTGELPEYVTKSEDGMTWVRVYGQRSDYITISEDWTARNPVEIKKLRGFMYRARTEIELVVDGIIIDLNRICFPADTPIMDKRKTTFTQKNLETHTEWISECLKSIQSIQQGMTRGQLLKLFTTEGGLSHRSRRRYVYRECPYIKIDVTFRPIDNDTKERLGDVITEVSKPFLEWSIID